MAATELKGVMGPGPAAIAVPGGGGTGPPVVGGGGGRGDGRGDAGPGSGASPCSGATLGTVAAAAASGPGPGTGGVAAAGPASAPPAGGSGGSGAGGSGSAREGWLFKWTNYIKGYQRRWFVLSNGLLSYYRSKAEMRHTCRGTINLATANITVEDSCNFMISNGGAQTYHLKASSEVERQRWVTALELAKAKAVKMLAESDESGDEESVSQTDKTELQNTLRTLSSKVEDLSTCNDLIAKHGTALQRSLSELESLRLPAESNEKIKQVNERATLFRITSNAMINACRDFLTLAQTHSKKWQKSLQYERDQRIRLEETLEQLAKQHNHLERAFRGATVLPANTSGSVGSSKDQCFSGKGDMSDEDDENEYFDAPEIIIMPKNLGHKRTGSNISGASSDISLEEQCRYQLEETKKEKRTSIPVKPNYSLNLWSIMKNCIGKELSKIPMPVNFNEPLSMLQRLTEDLEYHELLDKAAECESSLEQLCYVAAFTVSSYSTTVFRTSKPFNPLLGETFELDRLEENGYRSLCEQVSHHPPAAAHHAESKNGWTLRQEIKITSKFRGKYLSIMPLGSIHCIFHASGHHYTWKKVTTTVHNIIVGKLWIDQSGEIDIVNHKTGDKCNLKFFPYSYFSRDVPRKVTGEVKDRSGKVHFVLRGTWDEKMERSRPATGDNGGDARQRGHEAEESRVTLWQRNPLPNNAENMYYFSELALTLNAEEPGTAPTDSRLRPDQRLMEEGKWDEANAEKQRLEEKQRLARKRREEERKAKDTDRKDGNKAEDTDRKDGTHSDPYKALWFELKGDPVTKELTHIYRGGYWECKEKQDWSSCPDIF
ncbi:oxysterol-binding protein 1 [Pteronotus mesoamericanus]|uniref:oxysterol-binding protein 1 n=1 Tax=Pteronotus mesoamericanus TaxID=1884717 RepID=UPI0023EBE495|nr:oxysterol-binding protein 1 [Pteronotus parnellii mesoamericanus]